MISKRRKRHSPEQIVKKLRDADANFNVTAALKGEPPQDPAGE